LSAALAAPWLREAIRRPDRPLVWVAIAGLAIVPLVTANQVTANIAAIMALFAILSMSVNMLFGYAGQISFAFPVLFGAGAYAATVGVLKLGLPQPVAIVAGALAATIVGMAVGIPALRIRGLQLGLITLALLLAAADVFKAIFGFSGVGGIPPVVLAGFRLETPLHYDLLFVALLVVSYLALKWLLDGPFGRRLLLLKADDSTASSLGVNVAREKLAVYAISSLLLGLMGSLYPSFLAYLGPDQFGFDLLVDLNLIVMLGGLIYLEGAVLMAVLLGFVPQLLLGRGAIVPVVYGTILLMSLILLPRGLIGLIAERRRAAPPLVVRTPPGGWPTAGSTKRPIGDSKRLLLEATGVSKRFAGLQAVNNVSFSVEPGEIVALVGSNGAGKSTLINLLSGHLEPDAGSIRFGGADIGRRAPHERAQLGLVRTFQFPHLVDVLTVRENLQIGVEARAVQDHRAKVDEVLGWCGLLETADVPLRQLPFGLRKLVDSARAIVSRPPLVFLDEPAAGLSAAELPAIASLVRRARAAGTTFVIVEHNMEFTLGLVERVVVMDFGVVIASGTPAEVVSNPKVVEAYLGEFAVGNG
jgi:branched-chain amino acid transport system permease protein